MFTLKTKTAHTTIKRRGHPGPGTGSQASMNGSRGSITIRPAMEVKAAGGGIPTLVMRNSLQACPGKVGRPTQAGFGIFQIFQ